MRQAAYSDCGNISVHAIAGTRVVLLGLDMAEAARKGCLGFTIMRTGPDPRNPKREQTIPLKGGMHFEAADVWIDAKSRAKLTGQSDKHPIQAFLWGDYIAQPETTYTYEVTARYGKPGALTDGAKAVVSVTTECEEHHEHAIFFNRGVAGSQYYARTFDAYRRYYRNGASWRKFIRPADVPDRRAYKWLSRGLEEAMLDFIGQAKDGAYAIRAAGYEFTYMPFINALVSAIERGADVRATYHAKQSAVTRLIYADKAAGIIDGAETKAALAEEDWERLRGWLRREQAGDGTADENEDAIRRMSFADDNSVSAVNRMLQPRRNPQTFSHNKFMVLLKDGAPIQVWTGSTNYTDGGIFGQSNVGHIVRDPVVATLYLKYWEQMQKDPEDVNVLRDFAAELQPDLEGEPPVGVTPVFSPRPRKSKQLDWYVGRFAAAKQSVFFTSAFGVSKQFFGPATDPKGPTLRYLMLEAERFKDGPTKKDKKTGKKVKTGPDLDAIPNNRIAWGDTLRAEGESEEDMIETLTGLNGHVNYLHTKYMLVDVLTDDPLVISGSANFSEGSTFNNDENMLIIRGDTRVADVYLGEFMRLFNHFRIRNEVNALSDEERENSHHLAEDDSWAAPYFDGGSQLERERRLFAAPPAALKARRTSSAEVKAPPQAAPKAKKAAPAKKKRAVATAAPPKKTAAGAKQKAGKSAAKRRKSAAAS